MTQKSILFICQGNAVRSQLAQAIINQDYGQYYQAQSAGLTASEVDPRAVATLARHGYSTKGLQSTALRPEQLGQFDYLITLCASAKAECQPLLVDKHCLSWDLAKPVANEQGEFEQTLAALKQRIRLFHLVQTPAHAQGFDPLLLNKCLSDQTRLLLLLLLYSEQELCVGELCAALQLSQPKISRALSHLRHCGLLKDRRVGQWVFYSLADLPAWVLTILEQQLLACQSSIQAAVMLLSQSENLRPLNLD
ncbi:Arsenate reductase [Vibrio stylophorae]|uniref:Arsenate reductase n=1 Tax=Vibrio stylophorae TaxID=659351 RepID=A0ABN8DTL7_9VIBR|nr:metalloregulator ArsR/SmtB family transcription factor [Vibrio stylophorae]CAH0534170.1 Arsenate reductase [Vibrio stylophorae]